MKYPKLNEIPTTRDLLDKFKGYNHNLRIGEGQFYDMKNLTGDDYPILSPRKKRGTYLTPNKPNGMCSNTNFCYVDGRDFYIGDQSYDLKLTDSTKDLISIGSNIVILPDHKYINTTNTSERGNLKNGVYELPGEILGSSRPKMKIEFLLYNKDKQRHETVRSRSGRNAYINYQSDRLPAYTISIEKNSKYYEKIYDIYRNIGKYAIGLCFENDDKEYFNITVDKIQNEFAGQTPVIITGFDYPYPVGEGAHPIKASGFGNLIDKAEAIGLVCDSTGNICTSFYDVSGTEDVEKNGIILLLDDSQQPMTEWLYGQTGGAYQPHVFETPVMITAPYNTPSDIPSMDYIIESSNRLWGCRYGSNNKGDFVNEIYASKLGDFKNWVTVNGISTDSYTVSVGTSGAFTGAINYGGKPIFFKEDCMHRVFGDFPSNYQVQTIMCKGVQEGCSKSLAIVNDVLYYKSRSGICAFDGSLPVEISAEFGDKQYKNAVAGAIGNKYYVSMKDIETDDYVLFVYDTIKRMWHKEDDTQVTQFCNHKGELYYIDYADNNIHTVKGTGVIETEPIPWSAETGILGASTPDDKYVTKIDIRMSVAKGSTMSLHIEYDSMGEWERLMEIEGLTLNTFTIPVRPRRCDHFRLRFEGEGDAKIFSISKTLEETE